MKSYFSAFLLLLTVGNAQVIFSESFDSGVLPDLWQKRFGRVVAVDDGFAFGFANRTSNNDAFSAPIDMSASGSYTLTFDFKSDAGPSHSLLVGLSTSNNDSRFYFGSPAAAPSVGLQGVFSGFMGWSTVSFDLTPYLANYSPSDLTHLHVALMSWNSGEVSSLPNYIDNISVSYAAPSAIPEPSTSACLAGLVALLLAIVMKRRACA